MSVADYGEFGLIARVTARLGTTPACLLGPGDDAALVAAPDRRVLASTDVLVEGRHFRRDWSSARDVGHRAAAANLADIAAMGGVPTSLLVAFCAPADLDLRWVEELTDGLAAEAAKVGAGVVGGDTTASPLITVAVTALGDLDGRAPVAVRDLGDLVEIDPGRPIWGAADLRIRSTRPLDPDRPLAFAY